MTIKSYFYDSVGGDRPYSGADFADAFGTILTNGVIPNDPATNDLGIDIGGTNFTTIYAGKAVVQGHFVNITGTETLTVPAGTYSGMIVLRVDITGARAASLAVRTDQTPQQDASIWELPLYNCNVASGVITGVTDVRTQGGATAKTASNVVTWSSDPNGIVMNTGLYNNTGKPIKLFLTSAQPAASASEIRTWIQIENF